MLFYSYTAGQLTKLLKIKKANSLTGIINVKVYSWAKCHEYFHGNDIITEYFTGYEIVTF